MNAEQPTISHSRGIKIGLGISVFAAISFGLYPAAAKAAYSAGANTTAVIISTTFARALALVMYCLKSKRRVFPEPAFRRNALTGGFCQAVSVFGIIGSLAYIPAAVTIILMFTHTIMLMLYMSYRKELALTSSMVFSTIGALFGVSLVVDLWSHSGTLNGIGLLLAMLAAFATASRLYLFGKEVLLQHPIVVGAQVFSAAAIFTLLLCFYQAPIFPESIIGFGWIALCALAMILGTFGMFFGIGLLGSFQWSLMAKLEPVFTALFAFMVLGEQLAVQQYVGVVLVIGSLISYQLLQKSISETKAS